MKIILLVLLFSFSVFAGPKSVLQAPDGIQIGSDTDGRLPILQFDEYPFEDGIGEMTAGEVRTLNFGTVSTFAAGAHCLAELSNPQTYNADKLLILHSWYDGTVNPPVMKVMVKNLSASTADFSNDQLLVSCWNTNNLGKRKK